MALERGTLLNNRYRIVQILGQGGMGSVYRAVDENLGVEVAVKDNFFTTEEYARQFWREATILASLRHPNLPRVTDHFVVEGQGQYLVMDFIEGEDLRQRMDRIGLISEEDAIVIGAAVNDALAYLGDCNPPIVHRDIKPGNVKITPEGKIYLVDFGLAKVLVGSQMTTTGARAMTPGYSPPEQYGTARTDQRSDIYSLGATLYASLTGVIPEDALARAMDQSELTPIRRHNPKVSRRVSTAIEKSLAVRPDDRYQDAEEFKYALLNASSVTNKYEGEFLVAPPPEIPERSLPLEFMEGAGGVGNGGNAVNDGLSPLPVPINSPATDRSKRKSRTRPRRRKSNRTLLWLVLILLLLTLSGVVAYTNNPNLPYLAASLISGRGSAQGIVVPPVGTPTPTATEEPSATDPIQAEETDGVVVVVEHPSETATATLQPTETMLPVPTSTPTPVPTLMGAGRGELAFASDATGRNQIYLVNIDGSNLRKITDMSDGACQPDWSPDGKKLVFISPCVGNNELYPGSALFIIDLASGNLMPLPTVPGGDFDPDWSPDGHRIAFTSLRKGGRPQLYMVDLQDKTVELASDPKTFSRDMQPDWSPDGQRIAFTSIRKGYPQIWFLNLSDGKQELFSHSGSNVNSHPRWSPDGKVLLYTQRENLFGTPMVVFSSLDQEGVSDNRLTQNNIPIREATYSQDGIWVAFESWPEGSNHDIYIMTSNGAGRLQVTNNPRLDFDPVWRPAEH